MKKPYIEAEEKIMEHLIEAYKLFAELEQTHTSHLNDFEDGIHKCQGVLTHRIVQRDYPDKFPVIKE